MAKIWKYCILDVENVLDIFPFYIKSMKRQQSVLKNDFFELERMNFILNYTF